MVDLVREKLPAIQDLCRHYKVGELQLFGSAVSGEFDPRGSDIDLIVEMGSTDNASYFGLLDALESLFGRKVDLLEKQAVRNPYFIRSIKRNRETLYAA